jgi:hypothetical protein
LELNNLNGFFYINCEQAFVGSAVEAREGDGVQEHFKKV